MNTSHIEIDAGRRIAISYPEGYYEGDDPDVFQLITIDQSAAFSYSVYEKPKGATLDDACETRLSSLEEWYEPVKPGMEFNTKHSHGAIFEFEGTWPGEVEPTYYVVCCIALGDLLVTVGVVTDREYYEVNRIEFEDLLKSTRLI